MLFLIDFGVASLVMPSPPPPFSAGGVFFCSAGHEALHWPGYPFDQNEATFCPRGACPGAATVGVVMTWGMEPCVTQVFAFSKRGSREDRVTRPPRRDGAGIVDSDCSLNGGLRTFLLVRGRGKGAGRHAL